MPATAEPIVKDPMTSEAPKAAAPPAPKNPKDPKDDKAPKHPACVGTVLTGKSLKAVLADETGQFEVTRAGRTDRVTVRDTHIAFTPDVPDPIKVDDTGAEWAAKKIAD